MDVEGGGGFVKQRKHRPMDEQPRECEPLLLTCNACNGNTVIDHYKDYLPLLACRQTTVRNGCGRLITVTNRYKPSPTVTSRLLAC